MKIPRLLIIAAATAVIVILYFIFQQNNIASSGVKRLSYTSFNWSKPAASQEIMTYWRAHNTRMIAVKKIVWLDYLFMILYCSVLCFSLNYARKKESRRWLKTWLAMGIGAIILCTVIDAIQDYKIFQYIKSKDVVTEMRYYTWIKWGSLVMGLIPLILSMIPGKIFSLDFAGRIIRYLSQLLKSLWVFFPGILFLLLTIFCFWKLGQGKDIIVAFTENKSRTIFGLNYTRIVFFLAIGFWIYVSWYSSRIISYIKKTKQQRDLQKVSGTDGKTVEAEYNQRNHFFEIGKDFLDEFPRIIGNGCFLILELAVLQSPVLYSSLSSSQATILFVMALIILRYFNKWISETQAAKPDFRKAFWIFLSVFIILTIVTSLFQKISIWTLFVLLLLFHLVFIYYINLRRVEMEKTASKVRLETEKELPGSRSIFERIMDYFCIPRKEAGYFKWFLFIGAAGIILYFFAIILLNFSRNIGPFPFMILAFGVLLAFGNIVTAFSVRYKLNFHFLLFVAAFLLSNTETHYVRTLDLKNKNNGYENRPHLRTYLSAWLNDRKVLEDTSKQGFDMYFVMANGGASRSGYWTAAVLGKLEDSSIANNVSKRFSDRVFCLSGTSGGGVGVATFFSLLRDKAQQPNAWYESSAKSFLKQDYFTYTLARMLGPDYFNYIFHVTSAKDRGAALEESFEESSLKKEDSIYQIPFYDTLSQFPAMKDGKVYLPILCVNTTRMQDGNPGLVTNFKLDAGFNNRVDVVNLLGKNTDISITSGSILGARFPYLSPAGRIGDNYFVDGGYFDNSGAGVVQEIIRNILNIAREDTILSRQIKKIHFKVLHIVNSPVGFSRNVKPVDPIKNDLLGPLLTIIGTYDMQTTVNDMRLINFISDINKFSDNRADYVQISLYEERNEWKQNPLNIRFRREPPYAMNWFMSDTTLNRINKRLTQNIKLDSLIKAMNAR
ncbi:MAG: patatin-like phospholipase family protein [Chitinophagaceae bacterium]|nr:patatin-like phospholipase family protein [Chitinophagaceae bacterium]